MTSHQLFVLNNQDVQSLTMLAILHPGMERSLFTLYRKHYRHQPRDLGWQIDGGPSTARVKERTVKPKVLLKFLVKKRQEFKAYELAGNIEKTTVVGSAGNEWLLVVTGTLWRYCVGSSDAIQAQNVTIPCFYNSHSRKGFGLVPLITSYEVYAADVYELQKE